MSGLLTARTAVEPMRPGYYLVAEGKRHWISHGLNEGALCKLLDRLYPEDMPHWWIDYCIGADIDGRPAWMNLDYTEAFRGGDYEFIFD